MKKIVYVITNIKKCGPYMVLKNLINNNLDKKIAVISIFGKNDKEEVSLLESKNVKVINLNLNKITFFTKGKKMINDAIKKINPSVIHSHGLLPDVLNSKCKNSYKVTTLHNNMQEDYLYSFGRVKSLILINWHRNVLKKLDKIVCCSKSIYDATIKKNDKYTYVRNGIDLNKNINYDEKRKQIKQELNIDEDARVYIYAGVLSKGKGIVKLIQLFEQYKLKNEVLVVVGDGEEKERCKEISSNNVKIIGYKQNVIDYLIASDVYISNSRSEGLSISILEALLCRNLILLSNIPSHNEMLELFKKENIGEVFCEENFKEKIENIRRTEPINDEKMERIQSELSAQKMTSKYNKIYESGVQ